jgi:hypothetical protein
MTFDTASARVRAGYEEMPGMTLTMPQASRLFGLEPHLCQKVVDQLVRCSFLRRTERGGYSRVNR